MSEVLTAYGSALTHYADPQFLLYLFGGLVAGICVGILPGLGVLTGITLFLPFVFFLKPWQALPFMISFLSVANIGGTVTTYLLGIPGETSNMPGLMDGFAMSRKGECARALGAAQMGSFLGSAYTVFWALLIIPLIVPIVLTLTSSEMVFIILLGIATIVTLSTGSMVKGLIAGVLGLFCSMVGYHFPTATERFTFSTDFLYNGLPLLPVMLGLFAMVEVVNLIASGGTISEAQPYEGWQGVRQGVRDVFRFWKLNLFASIIGFIVGIIPGIGGSVAGWISYGTAKTTSKHPELFGTGVVEGVIGPESANDATSAGSFLTLFALGMPSSGSQVIVIVAMVILGLVPGPLMMSDHLDIVGGMIMIKLVAATVAVTVTMLLAPTLAKIANVPNGYVVPLVLVFVFIGVFAANVLFRDFITLIVFGVIGLLMQRFGFSRPAFILGFILGDLFEKYFWIALVAWGPLFWTKPTNLVLIAIIIACMAYSPIISLFQKRAVARARG